MMDFNPKDIQAMAAGTSARYGYEVPEATATVDTGTDTGTGAGKLSGSDLAAIINGAVGAGASIIDSLKGLWTKDGGSGTSTTLQQQNLATLNNKSNNTWVWVAGGAVVVGLIVFLVLRKKK